MLVYRDLAGEIKPFIKRREFIAIIGPRQCGKTTLLGMIKNSLLADLGVKEDMIKIVTFEDRKLLSQFESDPVAFVRSFFPQPAKETAYFIIDEFQYADEGGQKLKLIYDTVKGVKIIITGSSSLDLKAKVGKYMVGRILTFNLYPFNFGEFLRAKDTRLERVYHKNSKKIFSWCFEERHISKVKSELDIFGKEIFRYYEDFCIWGGYPAVILSETIEEKKKLLAEIYNNYVLKDIKGLLELATERNLLSLSQYLATQIGNLLVYQNLAQASELNYRQLKKHLNILKETFLIWELRPFFKNRQKELSKNPKIFFVDMGFRNNLMENMNSLDKRSDAGAIIENAVFIRLKQLCQDAGNINFWRTKAGAEVDFIIHVKGKILPIEVKFSKFRKEQISKSFLSFVNSFRPDKGIVLTKDFWGTVKKGKTEILFAPAYYI